MLRIHDILVWIRIWIRGSMPLTYGSEFGSRCGSGSCYFRHLPNFFKKSFSAYYCLKVHLHHFSKIKNQKKSQSSRNQCFSFFFLLCDRKIRMPKNKRIRIRNTASSCFLMELKLSCVALESSDKLIFVRIRQLGFTACRIVLH